MQIKRFTLTDLATNCYVLYNENDQNTIIIDPAEICSELNEFINSRHLKPLAIWLTHGHFDHIGGVEFLVESFHVPVYIHQLDANFLIDENLNLSSWMGKKYRFSVPVHLWSNEIETIDSGIGEDVTVINTPGHTDGSVCYYFTNLGWLFSGDTLFTGSIGRVDLPGGDLNKMNQSLAKLIRMILPKTKIFPGHGINTIFQSEQKHNPYLKNLN